MFVRQTIGQKGRAMENVHIEVRGADSVEQVAQYLPRNYRAVGSFHNDGRLVVEVFGHDDAGWTAEGYVIPRLASGLLWGSICCRSDYTRGCHDA